MWGNRLLIEYVTCHVMHSSYGRDFDWNWTEISLLNMCDPSRDLHGCMEIYIACFSISTPNHILHWMIHPVVENCLNGHTTDGFLLQASIPKTCSLSIHTTVSHSWMWLTQGSADQFRDGRHDLCRLQTCKSTSWIACARSPMLLYATTLSMNKHGGYEFQYVAQRSWRM